MWIVLSVSRKLLIQFGMKVSHRNCFKHVYSQSLTALRSLIKVCKTWTFQLVILERCSQGARLHFKSFASLTQCLNNLPYDYENLDATIIFTLQFLDGKHQYEKNRKLSILQHFTRKSSTVAKHEVNIDNENIKYLEIIHI